jgi:carbonic anhydrase
MTNAHVGLIDNWIRHIKDVYRMNYEELQAITDVKTRVNRYVELNVFEQVCNLAKTSIVQGAWERKSDLHLHGWVYDVADGLIKDLEVTLKDNSSLQSVYKLDI